MKREEVLDTAKEYVMSDRQTAYGKPEQTFELIAAMWDAYLGPDISRTLTAADVAAMMALLKIARLRNNPGHMDGWVDLAGYAACGAEAAENGYGDKEKK